MADWPDVAAEFDFQKNAPLTPDSTAAGSPTKRWWFCGEGHSWEAVVSSRTHQGRGCPFCSGRRVIPGENDLATLFPELAKEWSDKNEGPASEQLANAWKEAWWMGECGHEFLGSIGARTRRGSGCPFCSNHQVLAGFNDLATLKPEIASEWHPRNSKQASEFTWGSNKKAWWQCRRGHEWEALIRARTSNRSGCPFCAGNRVILGETDLTTTHPEIAATWDWAKNPGTPMEFSSGSLKKLWWRCDRGHSWEARIYSRKTKGCPVCAGRVIEEGFNDLASQRPDYLENWDFELNEKLPSEVSMNSYQKFWWKCELGHSYLSPVTSRNRGRGCAVCAGKQVVTGFNDLRGEAPGLAAEWHPTKNLGSTPSSVTTGSGKKAWWVCPIGHEYKSVIASRVKGSGCTVCDNKMVLAGFNDLASQRPDLVGRWHPTKNSLSPDQVTAGSVKRIWWICAEGHEWQSTPASQASGHDCPLCGNFGYRGALPGIFYFLENEKIGAAKVGITNVQTRNSRIKALGRYGFRVVKTWVRDDGYAIRDLETHTLRYIRQTLGLPPYLGKGDLGQTAGWKETFCREGISEYDLILWVDQKLLELEKDREGQDRATQD